MSNFNWEEIKKEMEEGVVAVTFNKADGSERVMECTLSAYLLPDTVNKSNHTGLDTMIVYDLDAEGWRSFRFDKVISVEVL